MPRYFAFGSNLDADQMAQRCPGSRVGFRACLLDHRIAFTYASRRWGGGAADVVPAPGHEVWGMVWELSDDDLARLDGYELGYQRCALEVIDGAGMTHTVTSYSVVAKGEHRPTQEYLDKMLRWGEHWGFPRRYLDLLRRYATQNG
jgi:AIG2-like family